MAKITNTYIEGWGGSADPQLGVLANSVKSFAGFLALPPSLPHKPL